MNKIQLMLDTVKTMKAKESFQGTLKAEGSKDQVKFFGVNNEFARNSVTGTTQVKINTEYDYDGNKVKHESNTEFNRIGFLLHVLNDIQLQENPDQSFVLSLSLNDFPEGFQQIMHERMNQEEFRQHFEQGAHGFLKELHLVENPVLKVNIDINKKHEIPMIVVSAKSEDIDKIRGLEYGADDYLTKPFSPAELAARIKSHIKRYERLKGNDTAVEVINHKGLEINTASHKVFVSGKEVQLTTKEYELLLFLASNPNIVFTKEHLFDSVWGDEYYGDSATVAVHIQKIRKKVEKDPANPELIETLWGTGYRFNP